MPSVLETLPLRAPVVRGRAFLQPRSSRMVCRAREPATERREKASAPKGTLDVLEKDISFIEDVTGVPLKGSMVDIHDQLVCMLNPLVAEERQKDLEEKIRFVQEELRKAHEQVHNTEERLSGSISHLSYLQEQIASIPMGQEDTGRSRVQTKKKGPPIATTLKLPEGLKEHWHPTCFSSKLSKDMMIPVQLFDEEWIVFRDNTGAAQCLQDECAHRACPLSAGSIVDGQAQCPYHGWTYNGKGECTAMPSTRQCKGVTVKSLPVMEKDGLVWVWPGNEEPQEVPNCTLPPEGFEVHSELLIDVPVEHGLLIENLLDLAHAPFTHTSTFAKGWPIPDVVNFKAHQMLSGNWEPYPIDMSFEPPCMVLSKIGLARPGQVERGVRADMCENHLHQLHVCLPSSEGRTTLLYRMSMDFMGWTKYVPGIQKFWSYIAGEVLGEDLVIVKGQQERLQAGSSVWANPMAYDKLGIRYRRWRNAVGDGDTQEQKAVEREMKPMSAGELFAVEETV